MQYIISITAQDRPGIVAGVSQAILETSGNIEAASQTVHQRYFAMIIKCAFPGEINPADLTNLIHLRTGADLHVYITPYQPPAIPFAPHTEPFIVTALGPDQPGVLHKLTSYLASKNINIDDLYSRKEGQDFVVICQVSLPRGLDVFMLQTDLEAVGSAMGFVIHMQHENIFVATNELHLRRTVL